MRPALQVEEARDVLLGCSGLPVHLQPASRTCNKGNVGSVHLGVTCCCIFHVPGSSDTRTPTTGTLTRCKACLAGVGCTGSPPGVVWATSASPACKQDRQQGEACQCPFVCEPAAASSIVEDAQTQWHPQHAHSRAERLACPCQHTAVSSA